MGSEQIVSSLKANPISVVCGALALTLCVGIYLRSDRVPESEETLAQKTSQGERIDANLKNGVQLAEQYTALAAYRAQIDARMVHPEELAQNLQFFYKLESDTRTKLVDIRQSTPPGGRGAPKGKSYFGVSYFVSVRGDYAHLIDFLHRLESRQRYCRVLTATLAVSGASDRDRSSEMTLSLALELLGQP